MSNLLVGLVPQLITLAEKHKEISKYEGIEWMMVQGHRTWQEQIELYSHGRERSSGGWVVTDRKLVVTDALPAKDPHCRGAAYDIAILRDGRPTWNGIDDLYDKVGKLGEELGLVWGGEFKHIHDLGHFELKNWRDIQWISAFL